MFKSEYSLYEHNKQTTLLVDEKVNIKKGTSFTNIIFTIGYSQVRVDYDTFTLPNSHEIIINFSNGDKVDVYTDNMASIPVYYHANASEILVSNRLDWISHHCASGFKPNWKQVF